MKCSEFKRWLVSQGVIFEAGKGSHLKITAPNGQKSVFADHGAKGWSAKPHAPRASADFGVLLRCKSSPWRRHGCGLRLASHPKPQRPLPAAGFADHPKEMPEPTRKAIIKQLGLNQPA